MNELTKNDWLQIEQAAAGGISGTSDEWPALRDAIEKVRGTCLVYRKPAAWMQGFCEALVAMRKKEPSERS